MKLSPILKEVAKRTRVLRDRVLVKPLRYVNPLLATVGIEMQKGIVVAVGYGRRVRRRNAFKQMEGHIGRTLYFEDGDELGIIKPMQVTPGDVVEYSFRNYQVVDFDKAGFPGAGELLFVWQSAIYSIDPDESQSDSLLWQQSAGYDRQGNFLSGAEDWQRA